MIEVLFVSLWPYVRDPALMCCTCGGVLELVLGLLIINSLTSI